MKPAFWTILPWTTPSLLTTNASGAWDCEAVFGPQWMQLAWSKEWAWMDIMAKECTNHFKLCGVGSFTIRQQRPIQVCNNGVADSINKGSSKESLYGYAHFVMSLVFLSLLWYQSFSLSHSRSAKHWCWSTLKKPINRILKAEPYVCTILETISMPLLKLISPKKQDWTSSSFQCHFKCAINKLQVSLLTSTSYIVYTLFLIAWFVICQIRSWFCIIYTPYLCNQGYHLQIVSSC